MLQNSVRYIWNAFYQYVCFVRHGMHNTYDLTRTFQSSNFADFVQIGVIKCSSRLTGHVLLAVAGGEDVINPFINNSQLIGHVLLVFAGVEYVLNLFIWPITQLHVPLNLKRLQRGGPSTVRVSWLGVERNSNCYWLLLCMYLRIP